jgi:hypothetical protein
MAACLVSFRGTPTNLRPKIPNATSYKYPGQREFSSEPAPLTLPDQMFTSSAEGTSKLIQRARLPEPEALFCLLSSS